MTPWLIQRGRITLRDRKGLDGIVEFDYMGSAEFGALPEALRKMRACSSHLQICPLDALKNKKGQRMFIIATTGSQEEIKAFLLANSKEAYTTGLKEMTLLFQSIREDKSYANFDFWWDIVNGWMCVFGKENAEKILKCIREKPEEKPK